MREEQKGSGLNAAILEAQRDPAMAFPGADDPDMTPEQREWAAAEVAKQEQMERTHGLHPVVRFVTYRLHSPNRRSGMLESMSLDAAEDLRLYLVDCNAKGTAAAAVRDLKKLIAYLPQIPNTKKLQMELSAFCAVEEAKYDLLKGVDLVASESLAHERRARALTGGKAEAKTAGNMQPVPAGVFKLDQLGGKRRA